MREEFGEALENDFQLASKRFWQTRRGRQCFAQVVYSRDGVLTSSEDVDLR